MSRLTSFVLATLLTLLVSAAAQADKFDILSGSLVFPHAPAVSSEQCPDGGDLYEVDSNSVSAQLVGKKKTLVFDEGLGSAIGCVYAPPLPPLENGAIGVFTGWIVLNSDEGELWASFELLDFPIDDVPYPFAVYISITFEGGTGKYKNAKGIAIGTGLDFPVGGGPIDNEWGSGVVVDTIEGVVKVKE